jgi:hypothetical protein
VRTGTPLQDARAQASGDGAVPEPLLTRAAALAGAGGPPGGPSGGLLPSSPPGGPSGGGPPGEPSGGLLPSAGGVPSAILSLLEMSATRVGRYALVCQSSVPPHL